jgi:hypothetical protein
MTLDFTPSPHAAFSQAFEALIDKAMEARQQAETPRTYLGASRLGEECERKLAYEYHKTPKGADKEFKGKTLRIFDMGHDGETRMAEYLRLAGFTLLTERPDGKQFGFAVGWDEAAGRFKISGHCDGIITGWSNPDGSDAPLACPSLWENKALGSKSWKDTVAKGVKKSKPVYYAQMQLYMAYLDVGENPGLFTATNRDTGEIYAEMIPFDQAAAQAASDRGARVVSTADPSEAPRIAREVTDFRCKFCDYADRCWGQSPVAAQPAGGAQWWVS